MPGYRRSAVGAKRKRTTVPLKRKRYRAVRSLRSGASTGSIQMQMMQKAFPTRWRRPFNYVDKITINPPASGLVAFHNFSCNSLFDPDRTGTGHQPMGFDELLGTVYNHYTVKKARISVTFSNDQADPATSAIVGIVMRDTPTGGSSDVTTIIERGDVKWGILGSGYSGNSSCTITMEVDVAKWLGLAKGVLADDSLRGTSVANPSEECYFKVFAAGIGTNDPPVLDALVTIVYDAYLSEPKPLVQS